MTPPSGQLRTSIERHKSPYLPTWPSLGTCSKMIAISLFSPLASRSAVALPKLGAALASARSPLVAEVLLDADESFAEWDAEELSTVSRDAGAAALLLPRALLAPIASEQALAASSYPGPVPLILDARQLDEAPAAEALAELREAGASALAVRAELPGCDALVAAARLEGLELLAFAADPADGVTLEAAGVCAVVYEQGPPSLDEEQQGGEQSEVEADDAKPAVRLAAWEGDSEGLDELREQGASALLLRDACGGAVDPQGAARCAALVRLSQSKHSRTWGGSMFGTIGENAPPEVRNRRLWDQSKRQAKEMMHESAASRGLPRPNIK